MVKYSQWGIFTSILSSDAKILKTISPYEKESECYISLGSDEANINATSVKNGEVYYYAYKSNSIDEDNNIKVIEKRITLNNGEITEKATGVEKDAVVNNCI